MNNQQTMLTLATFFGNGIMLVLDTDNKEVCTINLADIPIEVHSSKLARYAAVHKFTEEKKCQIAKILIIDGQGERRHERLVTEPPSHFLPESKLTLQGELVAVG